MKIHEINIDVSATKDSSENLNITKVKTTITFESPLFEEIAYSNFKEQVGHMAEILTVTPLVTIQMVVMRMPKNSSHTMSIIDNYAGIEYHINEAHDSPTENASEECLRIISTELRYFNETTFDLFQFSYHSRNINLGTPT